MQECAKALNECAFVSLFDFVMEITRFRFLVSRSFPGFSVLGMAHIIFMNEDDHMTHTVAGPAFQDCRVFGAQTSLFLAMASCLALRIDVFGYFSTDV